jgi:hypothetical protein
MPERPFGSSERRIQAAVSTPYTEDMEHRCTLEKERVLQHLAYLARIVSLVLVICGVMFGRTVASGSDPIRIDDCRIFNNHGYVAPFESLSLGFTNRGLEPATEVRFTVVYAGQTAQITDSGTFGPNVEIHHQFEAYRNSTYRGPAPESCAASYVRFEDGTVWEPRATQ